MHKFGCNKVRKDFRDYKYKSVGARSLPGSYRIKKKLSIKDQGMVSSCVAHALSSFEECIHNGKFSTNFIYGFRPKTYFQGEGMNMRDALHTLVRYGDCLYAVCPGNTEVEAVYNEVNEKQEDCIVGCLPYRIKSYARIFTERQIKEMLLRDVPVPISVPIRGDLYTINGIVMVNKQPEISGYHALLIVGYEERGWIIQNSWGEHWGDGGLAILPYDYPIDSAWALNIRDNVVIQEPIRWLAVIGNFIFNLFRK